MQLKNLIHRQPPRTLLQQATGVGTAVLTRWLGSGVQFLLNVVLGRALGSEGLGLYYLFYAWARLLGQISGLGLPSYALRAVAVMQSQSETSKIRPFLTKSIVLIVSCGLLLLLASLPFINQLSQSLLGAPELSYVLILSLVVGVLFALLGLFAEMLKVFRRAELALTLEFSALPGCLLIAILAATPFVTPVPALYAFVSTIIIVLLVALTAYRALYPHLPATGDATGIFRLKSMTTFWSFGLLSILFANLPFLLLPHFATPEQLGEFGVAYRLVALSGTVLAALASRFSPQFAENYAQGDVQRLAANFKKSQLYAIFIFTPLLLAMVMFAEPLLSLFGHEFGSSSAVHYLQIMAFGQLINSSTGLTAQYLNMIHREAIITKILLVSVVLMFLAVMLLGKQYGATGVAIAYSGTLAVQNIVTFLVVRRVTSTLKAEALFNRLTAL